MRNRQRTLPEGGADTVGARITAADDDHMFAPGRQRDFRRDAVTGIALVLLWQKGHGEVNAIKITARNLQVAAVFRAAGESHGIILIKQVFRRYADSDMCFGVEGHAFGFHLCHTAVDDVFFHFEVGYSVAQQPTDAVVLFEQCHLVSGTRQLLSTGHACRSGADNGNPFTGLVCRDLWFDPALFPTLVDNGTLDGLDGDRGVIDIQCAGFFARCRTDSTGKLREVVG